MATEKQKAAARKNVKKAAKLEIEGRSKMGKDELRRAISRAR
jgi:hypothetical protein